MQFQISSASLTELETPCLVVAVGEEGELSSAARQLDEASNGYLSDIVSAGDIRGKAGDSLLLQKFDGIKARRVLLLGMGKESERNDRSFTKVLSGALSSLKSINISEVAIALDDSAIPSRDCYWRTRTLVEQFSAGLYQFDQLKSKKGDAPALDNVEILLEEADVETGEVAIIEASAIANGVSTARDLGNLPGNICTPTYLAAQAQELADEYDSLSLEVLEEAEMRTLGMGSLLSVSAGSEQPAKLIVLQYRGAGENDRPHVLVGKGITFDSGGISLKPGEAMDEMKYDMCGAASVMGTMTAVAELGLELNVVAVIAAAENMPSGVATKPGDIVTTLSGQTVEILNTDAEGRLVLCDALTYAERFQPVSVIDIATLTGACIIALGHKASGLLSNNDQLAEQLLGAGQYTNDKAWRLPLWDDYQEQLDSNFADIANIGGRPAGTITAACFLSRFTKDFAWAHLDIAGTAWVSGKQKGATGRCVPLLTQYLIDRADGDDDNS
ncbi:leucyl aminopeptidase [Motiliproteus sp.]|uniref:leucyl aminopeptidase n=1 Tax=Motiliproteus sp. TaxID=1898955 RepID=UPI003BA8E7A2